MKLNLCPLSFMQFLPSPGPSRFHWPLVRVLPPRYRGKGTSLVHPFLERQLLRFAWRWREVGAPLFVLRVLLMFDSRKRSCQEKRDLCLGGAGGRLRCLSSALAEAAQGEAHLCSTEGAGVPSAATCSHLPVARLDKAVLEHLTPAPDQLSSTLPSPEPLLQGVPAAGPPSLPAWSSPCLLLLPPR